MKFLFLLPLLFLSLQSMKFSLCEHTSSLNNTKHETDESLAVATLVECHVVNSRAVEVELPTHALPQFTSSSSQLPQVTITVGDTFIKVEVTSPGWFLAFSKNVEWYFIEDTHTIPITTCTSLYVAFIDANLNPSFHSVIDVCPVHGAIPPPTSVSSSPSHSPAATSSSSSSSSPSPSPSPTPFVLHLELDFVELQSRVWTSLLWVKKNPAKVTTGYAFINLVLFFFTIRGIRVGDPGWPRPPRGGLGRWSPNQLQHLTAVSTPWHLLEIPQWAFLSTTGRSLLGRGGTAVLHSCVGIHLGWVCGFWYVGYPLDQTKWRIAYFTTIFLFFFLVHMA